MRPISTRLAATAWVLPRQRKSFHARTRPEHRKVVASSDVSLPLAMVYPPGTSKLYHDAGAQILSWLEDESIAFNYHSGGATPSTFTRVCHPEHE